MEGREEQMDVNCTERRLAECTQRGSAATWHRTWALPSTLAVGLPEKWEGVGQKESGSQPWPAEHSLERGCSRELAPGAMEFRSSVFTPVSPHERREWLTWMPFIHQVPPGLSQSFLLRWTRRPIKLVFYSVDIIFLVSRVRPGTTALHDEWTSSAVLYRRTFCSDGSVPHLHCPK